MPTIELPNAARSGQNARLIDLQAAAEAAVALHSVASRTKEGALAIALAAADEILAGSSDPEVYARLRSTVTSSEFAAGVRDWTRQLRGLASVTPDTGACTLATALHLWSWTLNHLRSRENVVTELAEAIVPLLAARSFAVEVGTGTDSPLRRDLCHVYTAREAARIGATCAELVYGYRRHPLWDAEGCASCYASEELDELEGFIPGFASGARTSIDVIEADGSHPAKEGPCAKFDGLDTFLRLRNRLDGCLTGARLARDRAAEAIAKNA